MRSTFPAKLIEGPLKNESRPCSCGGSNENCYKCSGIGFIHGSEEGASVSIPIRRRTAFDLSGLLRRFGLRKAQKTAERQAAKLLIKCDRCGFRALPNELALHKETAHQKAPARPPSSAISVPSQPGGGNKPRRPDEKFSSNRQQHVVPSSNRSAVCPICRSRMKPTNLKKHLRKVHKHLAGPVPFSLSRKSKRSQVTQQRDRRFESSREKNDWQIVDEREAHRQMGFVARENGRYGSHPLHDRFDDESEP